MRNALEVPVLLDVERPAQPLGTHAGQVWLLIVAVRDSRRRASAAKPAKCTSAIY
jgi:hypothetical protein